MGFDSFVFRTEEREHVIGHPLFVVMEGREKRTDHVLCWTVVLKEHWTGRDIIWPVVV